MPWKPQSRVLLVVAAPAEARAVLDGLGCPGPAEAWQLTPAGSFDVLLTGVSKANAAGAAGRLADSERHSVVLSVGVAGALPGAGLEIGDIVIGSQAVHADEGVQTPNRFINCAAMGFPLGPGPGAEVPADSGVVSWLQKALATARPRVGGVATVSTCSGMDALAKAIQARTGAIAECMEGAAVGLVAQRLGIPFGEIRAISNTTGDRAAQVWDLPKALQSLSMVIRLLATSKT